MTRATTVPPVSGSGLGGAAPSRLGRAATQSGAAGAAGGLTGASATSADEGGEDACRRAWTSLAGWLRAGRLERGMSIADIARTTKIQARILEDLEEAVTEGLPADVFVRGFVRNYARCVGLSEAEALARYAACSRDAGPVASPAATAIAEMYAPATRRMSTVVPVAPGSPAAEVHAQGPHRYARAATAPSVLSSSPRLPRAMTDRGAELAPELVEQQARDPRELREPGRAGARTSAVMPAVVYPRPAGSGLTPSVDAAAVAAAVAAEVSRPVAVGATPAAVTPMQSMPALGSEAMAQAATAAPPARAPGAQSDWPSMVGGQSRLSAKKRRGKKRKDKQQERHPRAATVRPLVEDEIFEAAELEPATSAAEHAAVVSVISSGPSTTGSHVAQVAHVSGSSPTIEASIASAAGAVREEGWPGADLGATAAAAIEDAPATAVEQELAEVWIPRMPPAPRPSRAFLAPTLTIDDADPESASRLQDDRNSDREGRDPTRRTFLPPILLESQDRANRQGGLTLAVIILLIAATLTLSYLMRRPSSAGGGMTMLEAPVMPVGPVGPVGPVTLIG